MSVFVGFAAFACHCQHSSFVCMTRRFGLGLAAAKCKTIVRFLSSNHFSFCGFTNQLLLLLHNNAFYADVVQTIRKCDKRKEYERKTTCFYDYSMHAEKENDPNAAFSHLYNAVAQ